MEPGEEGSNPRTVEPSAEPGCLDVLKDEGHQGVGWTWSEPPAG